MKAKFILILMFLLVYSCKFYPQQDHYESYNEDFNITLYKVGESGTPTSEGLQEKCTATRIGATLNGVAQGVHYRALYQWNITDDMIPDNATIDSVAITFLNKAIECDFNLVAGFYNIPTDLSTSTNYSSMWEMFTNENKIVESAEVKSGSFGRIPVQPGNWGLQKLIDALQNSLPENKLVLGIKSGTENIDTHDRLYSLLAGLDLRVTYSLPHQSVRVVQILSNGNQYGNIGRYEENSFIDRITGTTYSLEIGQTEYFRADTNKATIADEKFNNWNNSSNVLNHSAFPIDSTTELISAKFHSIGNATIRNALEGSVSAGNIEFRDPWLRDDNLI